MYPQLHELAQSSHVGTTKEPTPTRFLSLRIHCAYGAGIWVRLKPALLWRYRRGAWQYDVIVALILAFVFLSPRAWFNDRPSRTAVHEIEASADGARVFWMDPSVLDGTAPNASSRRLQEVLRERSGEDLTLCAPRPPRTKRAMCGPILSMRELTARPAVLRRS